MTRPPRQRAPSGIKRPKAIGVVCLDQYPGPEWAPIVFHSFPQVAYCGDLYINELNELVYVLLRKGAWEITTNYSEWSDFND